MKTHILFGLIFIAQFCVDDTANISPSILTSNMVYTGQVENVRSALSEYMQPEELERFLTVVRKFRNDAPRDETRSALKDLFALIYASKSTTSEADWKKIISGDNSVLTEDEIHAIDVNKQENPNDKWRLLKKLAQLRMNTEDANHITDILNKMGGNLRQFGVGRKNLVISALAAVSNKTENEVRDWIF